MIYIIKKTPNRNQLISNTNKQNKTQLKILLLAAAAAAAALQISPLIVGFWFGPPPPSPQIHSPTNPEKNDIFKNIL